MQVVIDVPDKVYEMVMNTGTYGCYRFNSTKAIREGVPLPEEHGILGDFKPTSKAYYAYLDQVTRYIKYANDSAAERTDD